MKRAKALPLGLWVNPATGVPTEIPRYSTAKRTRYVPANRGTAAALRVAVRALIEIEASPEQTYDSEGSSPSHELARGIAEKANERIRKLTRGAK